MHHPRILEAKRQAEKLNRYRIKHHNGAAILWRFDDPIGWALVGAFPNPIAAEDYLFAKLPVIESEM